MEIFTGLMSYNGYAGLKKNVLVKKSFTIGFGSYTKNIPIDITMMDVVTFIIALPITSFYIKTKHWIANNLLGIAFSVTGIQVCISFGYL